MVHTWRGGRTRSLTSAHLGVMVIPVEVLQRPRNPWPKRPSTRGTLRIHAPLRTPHRRGRLKLNIFVELVSMCN